MSKVRTTLTIDESVLRAVKVRAARSGRRDSEVIEAALRRELGLDLLERMWERGDLPERDAMELAVEAQHKTRGTRRGSRRWGVRAVLDPNVIISALISPSGSPARIMKAWERGAFEIVASRALIAELERALTYPKLRRLVPERDARHFVVWLGAAAELVDDPEDAPPVRSDDPGDDYLLSLASYQRVPLVSGDKHLLALAGRLPILTPAEFLKLLRTNE